MKGQSGQRTYMTTIAEIKAARKMRLQGHTYRQIAEHFGTSINFIWRIINFPSQQEIDNSLILCAREAIRLHSEEHLMWKEIADLMGIHSDTLRRRVARFGHLPLYT